MTLGLLERQVAERRDLLLGLRRIRGSRPTDPWGEAIRALGTQAQPQPHPPPRSEHRPPAASAQAPAPARLPPLSFRQPTSGSGHLQLLSVGPTGLLQQQP